MFCCVIVFVVRLLFFEEGYSKMEFFEPEKGASQIEGSSRPRGGITASLVKSIWQALLLSRTRCDLLQIVHGC